uniref:Single-stranded DNA-binding protein n=1 Tax=Dichelobacter nodosus TaxID=870 RepID=Q5I719_DICNO|nr:Orf146 [Dichelobacter nodosus]
MAGVNKVILLGYVGQNPDVRIMTNEQQVANFSLATNISWNDRQTGEKCTKTEWHRCVAYRRLAEIIGQYVRKGSQLYLEGRLETRKWKSQEGDKHYMTEIIVDEIQMIDACSDGSVQNESTPQPQSGAAALSGEIYQPKVKAIAEK